MNSFSSRNRFQSWEEKKLNERVNSWGKWGKKKVNCFGILGAWSEVKISRSEKWEERMQLKGEKKLNKLEEKQFLVHLDKKKNEKIWKFVGFFCPFLFSIFSIFSWQKSWLSILKSQILKKKWEKFFKKDTFLKYFQSKTIFSWLLKFSEIFFSQFFSQSTNCWRKKFYPDKTETLLEGEDEDWHD